MVDDVAMPYIAYASSTTHKLCRVEAFIRVYPYFVVGYRLVRGCPSDRYTGYLTRIGDNGILPAHLVR